MSHLGITVISGVEDFPLFNSRSMNLQGVTIASGVEIMTLLIPQVFKS
jgi:hypothetical protein